MTLKYFKVLAHGIGARTERTNNDDVFNAGDHQGGKSPFLPLLALEG